jgi:hypothetical protein
MEQSQAIEMFRKKFEMYKKIMDEKGEAKAWEELFKGYPERQKQNLGKFIDNASLAEGFSKGIEMYKQFGMEMQGLLTFPTGAWMESLKSNEFALY